MFSLTFWETLFGRWWKQVRILLKWSFIIEDAEIWRERNGLTSRLLYFRCFFLTLPHFINLTGYTGLDFRTAPLLNGKNYRKMSQYFTVYRGACGKLRETFVSDSRCLSWDYNRGRVEYGEMRIMEKTWLVSEQFYLAKCRRRYKCPLAQLLVASSPIVLPN
jgi:hypothetical protein